MTPEEVLRHEFDDEHGFCIYCQKAFTSPGRWKRHLDTQHEGSYRHVTLLGAMASGTEVSG